MLSPSTEEYDRGEKFSHYKQIPSLREVVFVAHESQRLEVFSRADSGAWTVRQFGPGDRATLEAIAREIDVDLVYRNPFSEPA